jgi:hypothetical protein
VIEQVFGGQDTLFGEHLRHARTNAAHILHLIAEARHIWMLNRADGAQQTRDNEDLQVRLS